MLGTLLATLSLISAPQERTPIALSGTVRALDEPAGAPGEGWFDLWVKDAVVWRALRVPVLGGRWTAMVPGDVRWAQVGRISLDGRGARVDGDASVALIELPRELGVRWTRVTRVRAREAGGEELSMPLQAVRGPGDFRPSWDVDDRIWTDGPPLVLPEWLVHDASRPESWAGHQRWWVGAFGFGWTSVDVDHAAGGDVWVDLVRAGDLELELVPDGLVRNALVFLTRGDTSQRLGEWPDYVSEGSDEEDEAWSWLSTGKPPRKPRRFVLDRLPVGDYDVVVSRAFDCQPHELLRVPVRVEHDRVTRAAIELRSSDIRDVARCRGSLRVPMDWGGTDLRLELDVFCSAQWRRVARASVLRSFRIEGDVRVWEWDGDLRSTGRFRARVEPFQAAVPFDFDAANPREVDLVVPPPIRCEVRVVDALDGSSLVPSRIDWSDATEPLRFCGSVTPGDGGAFAFLAPPGRIQVSARFGAALFAREEIELRPGPNMLELRMRLGHRIRVAPTLNGKRIAPPAAWSLYVTPVDGSGRSIEAHSEPDSIVVLLDDAGEYDVSWPACQGLVGIAPVRVEARGAEPTEVELALARTGD